MRASNNWRGHCDAGMKCFVGGDCGADSGSRVRHMLGIAAEQALLSDMKDKHGAVVSHSNGHVPLSVGHNRNSNRVGGCCCLSTHAEVDALWRLKEKNTGSHSIAHGKSPVVTQCREERKQGQQHRSCCALSKPCSNCVRWMQSYGVRRVFYSVDLADPKAKRFCVYLVDDNNSLHHQQPQPLQIAWQVEFNHVLCNTVTYETAMQRKFKTKKM
ncbi:hypothetical protein Pelo_1747 [Pelomyxa schiedti]|nr:hypothetical protein Pelo_1747 [Pelomyxa schiedti]